jgi:hypothetical protein
VKNVVEEESVSWSERMRLLKKAKRLGINESEAVARTIKQFIKRTWEF